MKKFTRTKEDFVCEHCGFAVVGDGYTNHCPKCLWSKHVDVNPGDRAEACGGMMAPVAGFKVGQSYSILHRCQKCGFERKNKMEAGDSFDSFLELQKKGPAFY